MACAHPVEDHVAEAVDPAREGRRRDPRGGRSGGGERIGQGNDVLEGAGEAGDELAGDVAREPHLLNQLDSE